MLEKEKCTGCSACESVCPMNAIVMQADVDGFLYPKVDATLCLECGLCEKICPQLQSEECKSDKKSAFLGVAKNDILREVSSSGGVFSLLAEKVLKSGGVVFGAAMSDDCYSVKHICVDDIRDLHFLQGSKYVQSDMKSILHKVKKALEEERWVLFSGTPCQIAGIRQYIGKSDKLLTVDVICHGVPSPLVWKKYVEMLERKYNSKIVHVSFRDKTVGWQKYSLKCNYINGAEYRQTVEDDLYLRGFVQSLFLRLSCYHCAYKNENYKSDITIGDFWGVEKLFPKLKENRGVSLVIAHTEKGEEQLNELKMCDLIAVPIETALRHNRAYYSSPTYNMFRERALQRIRKGRISFALEEYCGKTLFARILRKTVLTIKNRSS